MLNLKSLLIDKVMEILGSQKFLSMQIDITNLCNLRCQHCYHSHHKNSGALSLNEWKEVLDQYEGLLKKLWLKPRIVICGGEPLISKNLRPLIIEINSRWKDVRISILTNGTRFDEEILSFLKNFKIDFQISIDGPSPESHDKIRGKGNFEKSMEGIRKAKKHGFDIRLLSVLSKKTAMRVPEYFKLAKGLKVRAMNFTRLIPQGYGKNWIHSGQDDVLLGLDLKSAMEDIITSAKKYQVKTSTNKPLYHLIDSRLGANGKFGFQGLVVDYKGNLKASSRASYILGHVLRDGLENLFFNHPVMVALRGKQINGCGGCEFYSRCGGDRNFSYATTGSFLSEDIGCWLKTKYKTKILNEMRSPNESY